MSKTKGAGSTKNGRDSNAQRLGVKLFDGQVAKAGDNVGRGGDDTLFSLALGKVKFNRRRGRTFVDIVVEADAPSVAELVDA